MKFINFLSVFISLLSLMCTTASAQELRRSEVIMLRPSTEDVQEGDMIYITKDKIGEDTAIIIRKADGSQGEPKEGRKVLDSAQDESKKFDKGQGSRERGYESKETGFEPLNKEQKKGGNNKRPEKFPQVVQKDKGESAPSEQVQQQGPKGAPVVDSGLQKYMDSIVKKNLFMPLGSGREAPKQVFALTGVISNTSREQKSKAIIEQVGGNTSYYVSAGETFDGDAKVLEVQENTVKVVRSGEEIVLKLGVGPREGGPRPQEFGGQPRERQKEGEPTRRAEFRRRAFPASMPENIDVDKLPPFVRKMIEDRGISIEELKNNPELQEKLKNEFLQRFQEGGFPMPPVIGR